MCRQQISSGSQCGPCRIFLSRWGREVERDQTLVHDLRRHIAEQPGFAPSRVSVDRKNLAGFGSNQLASKVINPLLPRRCRNCHHGPPWAPGLILIILPPFSLVVEVGIAERPLKAIGVPSQGTNWPQVELVRLARKQRGILSVRFTSPCFSTVLGPGFAACHARSARATQPSFSDCPAKPPARHSTRYTSGDCA